MYRYNKFYVCVNIPISSFLAVHVTFQLHHDLDYVCDVYFSKQNVMIIIFITGAISLYYCVRDINVIVFNGQRIILPLTYIFPDRN